MTSAYEVLVWVINPLTLSILGLFYASAAWLLSGRFKHKLLTRVVVGRRCIVTGASKGLGKAVAHELAAAGAHVVLVARNSDVLVQTAEELRDQTGNKHIHSYAVDLCDYKKTLAFVRLMVGEVGMPEWIVCNAGAATPGFIADQLPELRHHSNASVSEHMMNSNYLTSVNLIRAVLQMAKESSQPSTATSICGLHPSHAAILPERIVIVGSVLSLMSFVGYSAYAASKYAVRGLADSLRSEFIPLGIKVHSYFPANMDTPGFEQENKTKPQITADIEGTASTMSSKDAARLMLAGVLNERFMITNDYLGELIRIYANGTAPRPNIISESLALPLLSLIFSIWGIFMDRKIKKIADQLD